ncbi:ricin-type beta-trefoil lectin domain protein [uncultured Roseibium sp.]|uniref:ricin-type beta-trefoil lectin domain protein n=1 Tax=uncultured Roseibium sp. TaxID=1936171 RepID=UPI0026162ACA|nr:ricin-type beta-trefoil lectin domain protein [uncultured Roseibium sp.]
MRLTFVIAACLAPATAAPALAEAPDLKTPAPVIYLADNLDEKDNLGWCIDTLGRGYSENLQTHSCKPQGGDVQFSFDASSGQIRSVEFSGKCMELIAPDDPKIAFGLRDCSDGNETQQFAFDTASGRITPKDQPDNCVAAGEASRSAGPFMSRDLILAPCASADAAMITWREKK